MAAEVVRGRVVALSLAVVAAVVLVVKMSVSTKKFTTAEISRRKEDEWAMHEERIDMNFDVKGKERRYGYDQEGKPIVYSTSGGSKSFPFSGLEQSCQIDCTTTSPEKINLRAELNGALVFRIESTYMGDTHIVLAQKSIDCYIHRKR